MLGSATVMLGPQEDIFDLNPAEHSIGLVKNFRVSSEPSYTDLTQGVKNSVVYSVMTSNPVRASMEVYEYTSSNIMYALGLEGADVVDQTVSTDISARAPAGTNSVAVADPGYFASGDTIMIYPKGVEGQVIARSVVSVSSDRLTVSPQFRAPVPNGSFVRKANVIKVGSTEDQPYLAAKIVGQLADRSEIVLLCPKIRVVNGFSLGFTTDNFDNLPFEFAFYELTGNDPFYREFWGMQAKMFTSAGGPGITAAPPPSNPNPDPDPDPDPDPNPDPDPDPDPDPEPDPDPNEPEPFKVAIWGQSEDHLIVLPVHTVDKEPLVEEGRVTFWWHNRADDGAAGVQSVTLDSTSVSSRTVTPPMIRMANAFMEAMPGRDVEIVLHAMQGTAPTELMDDSVTNTNGDEKRRWQDDWALHAAATADGIPVAFGWHSWFAAPGSWGQNYGQNMAAFLLGRAPDGNQLNYSESSPLSVNGIKVSRTLRDLYGTEMPLWIATSGAHQFMPYQDLDAATVNAGGELNFRLANKQRSTESWRKLVTNSGLTSYFSDPQIQLNGYASGEEDTQNPGTWRDQAHPSNWTEEGHNLRVTQMAHAILRGAGITSWDLPILDKAEWQAAGTHVDVWSSAGSITTLRREQGELPLDDTYPHWTDVFGFQVDGEPAHRAELQPEGMVRIYPNEGRFTSGSVLTFGNGGASGFVKADEDPLASAWQNYPIVDLGLSGLAGVPVLPLPPAPPLASTIEGASTFDVASTDGPYFMDPEKNGPMDEVTFRVKGKLNFGASGGSAALAGVNAQTLEVQVLTGAGTLRFYARGEDGTYIVNGDITTKSGIISDGVEFDLVMSLDHTNGLLRTWVDGEKVYEGTFTGTTIQPDRNLYFLGEFPENKLVGTFETLQVWKTATYDGSLPSEAPYDVITGPASVANAHPWHMGGDAK